jgi:hypothetical protein
MSALVLPDLIDAKFPLGVLLGHFELLFSVVVPQVFEKLFDSGVILYLLIQHSDLETFGPDLRLSHDLRGVDQRRRQTLRPQKIHSLVETRGPLAILIHTLCGSYLSFSHLLAVPL